MYYNAQYMPDAKKLTIYIYIDILIYLFFIKDILIYVKWTIWAEIIEGRWEIS